MRKVLLTRNETGLDGTFGRIATDNMFQATTLELPWANNKPNESCIPEGTYLCSLVDSPKYGRVYEIKGVPGRSHILFHPLNWSTQSNGCVGIGRSEGMVHDKNRKGDFRGIMSSRDATISFMNDLTDASGIGEDFTLTVRWDEHCNPEKNK